MLLNSNGFTDCSIGFKKHKNPKMTIRTLKMDLISPNHDLFYMWPPSFPELLCGKNTCKSPPMDLKPIPMCPDHNN
jgi:hypothetical protein